MLRSPLRSPLQPALRSPLARGVGGATVAQRVAAIYAAGRVGPWFDPSDLSTMYTTRAGSTLVGTPGNGTAQFVGLMHDKSQASLGAESLATLTTSNCLTTPGNDFSTGSDWTIDAFCCFRNNIDDAVLINALASSRLYVIWVGTTLYVGDASVNRIIVNDPRTRRVGSVFHLRIVKSGGTYYVFSNGELLQSASGAMTTITVTTWEIGRRSGVSNSGIKVSNLRIVEGVALSNAPFTPPTMPLTAISGTKLLTLQGAFVDNSGNNYPITLVGSPTFGHWPRGGYHALAANDTTARAQLSARVNLFVATATLATQSVTTAATNYTLAFSGAGSITLSGTGSGTYTAGSHTVTCTAGTLTATVSGTVTNADIRTANIHAAGSIPAYQRVTSAEDYDSVGFPYRLIPNGTSQSMATSTITPGVDSATWAVGIRKLNEATAQVFEFGNTASLTGSLSAATLASSQAYIGAAGTTAQAATASGFAAPITTTIRGQADISVPSYSMAQNGVTVASGSATLGTGNFEARALNLFARDTSGVLSMWFGGHFFGGMLMFGAPLSASELATLEEWVNNKTKAY